MAGMDLTKLDLSSDEEAEDNGRSAGQVTV